MFDFFPFLFFAPYNKFLFSSRILGHFFCSLFSPYVGCFGLMKFGKISSLQEVPRLVGIVVVLQTIIIKVKTQQKEPMVAFVKVFSKDYI